MDNDLEIKVAAIMQDFETELRFLALVLGGSTAAQESWVQLGRQAHPEPSKSEL